MILPLRFIITFQAPAVEYIFPLKGKAVQQVSGCEQTQD